MSTLNCYPCEISMLWCMLNCLTSCMLAWLCLLCTGSFFMLMSCGLRGIGWVLLPTLRICYLPSCGVRVVPRFTWCCSTYVAIQKCFVTPLWHGVLRYFHDHNLKLRIECWETNVRSQPLQQKHQCACMLTLHKLRSAFATCLSLTRLN